MCANTGWTWDYVRDHLDVPRLTALTKHWADHPPAHVQLARIAAYLGIKTEKRAESTQQSHGDLLDNLPAGQKPQVMTAEEYLATKKAQQSETEANAK